MSYLDILKPTRVDRGYYKHPFTRGTQSENQAAFEATAEAIREALVIVYNNDVSGVDGKGNTHDQIERTRSEIGSLRTVMRGHAGIEALETDLEEKMAEIRGLEAKKVERDQADGALGWLYEQLVCEAVETKLLGVTLPHVDERKFVRKDDWVEFEASDDMGRKVEFHISGRHNTSGSMSFRFGEFELTHTFAGSGTLPFHPRLDTDSHSLRHVWCEFPGGRFSMNRENKSGYKSGGWQAFGRTMVNAAINYTSEQREERGGRWSRLQPFQVPGRRAIEGDGNTFQSYARLWLSKG